MNLLISKLLHWFAFSGTMFFAAAPVGEVSAPAAAPAATPAASESAPAAAEPTPATPAAAPSLSDAVKAAAEKAEKELTKPGITLEEPKPVEVAKVDEVKPATEPAKTEPAKPAAEVNPLDKIGALPAEKITAALAEAPPEVQQYLKDKGITVEALAENSRMAAQTAQYQEMFPTVEAGKEALAGAQNFWKLDQGLPAVQTIEDFDKFMMDTLVPMSFIRDEAGNPIPDPNIPGAFKNDGSIAKLIDYSAAIRDARVVSLVDSMVKAGGTEDEQTYSKDLQGALKFVKGFIDNGYKMPGAEVDPKTLPKEVQEKLDRADRIEKESKERDAQTATKTYELNEQKIIDQTFSQVSPLIKGVLDNTAFNDKLKTHIADLAWTQVSQELLKNGLYTRQRDTMSPGADFEQRRVALNLSYLKPALVKRISDLSAEFGQPIVDNNKARHDKLDTQAEAGKMEPRTSGTTVQSHAAPSSPEDIGKKALEMAKAVNPNAGPGSREYWDAITKLKKLPTAV